jgi:hypothetical protein
MMLRVDATSGLGIYRLSTDDGSERSVRRRAIAHCQTDGAFRANRRLVVIRSCEERLFSCKQRTTRYS